jgi:hypothetical protein
MLHVLSQTSKVRQAAMSVHLERELSALMVYYPLIERVLSMYADTVNDTAKLARIIEAGLDTVAKYQKSVPLREDNQRLQAFLEVFLRMASPLFVVRCCGEGLRFAKELPATCFCGEEKWEEVTPKSTEGQIRRALMLMGDERILL